MAFFPDVASAVIVVIGLVLYFIVPCIWLGEVGPLFEDEADLLCRGNDFLQSELKFGLATAGPQQGPKVNPSTTWFEKSVYLGKSGEDVVGSVDEKEGDYVVVAFD